jgi:hypothetical protein
MAKHNDTLSNTEKWTASWTDGLHWQTHSLRFFRGHGNRCRFARAALAQGGVLKAAPKIFRFLKKVHGIQNTYLDP